MPGVCFSVAEVVYNPLVKIKLIVECRVKFVQSVILCVGNDPILRTLICSWIQTLLSKQTLSLPLCHLSIPLWFRWAHSFVVYTEVRLSDISGVKTEKQIPQKEMMSSLSFKTDLKSETVCPSKACSGLSLVLVSSRQ